MTARKLTSGQGAGPDDAAELRREIEQTRQELGDTVEALARKADVKARARQTVAGARERIQSRIPRIQSKIPRDTRSAQLPLAILAGVAVLAGLTVGWWRRRRA